MSCRLCFTWQNIFPAIDLDNALLIVRFLQAGVSIPELTVGAGSVESENCSERKKKESFKYN